MNINEIKKLLYKKKPTASKFADDGKSYFYDCMIDDMQIFFHVPYSEMGDKFFQISEPAHLLIRWYTKYEVIE